MKRIGTIFALAAVLGCSAAHKAHFALDKAGRPTAASGAVTLATNWWLAGSAPQHYDATLALDGGGAATGALRSTSPPGGEFGTVMTCVDAAPLRGQRLALAASVAATAVAQWAGLWMRVDGANGSVTAFDNMQDRPLGGTSAAAQYQVVLDVDANAADVCYGVLLVDAGAVQFSALATRVVDHSVPTTDGGLGNGWFLAGSDPARYLPTLSFDATSAGQGSLASRDNTVSADQFGTIMTSIDASSFVGHKLTLAGSVAPTAVSGWAGLWMRIDDANGKTVAFDNMQDRPISGTAAAAPFSVVLDVPASAQSISFGILLDGSGRVDFTALALH